LIPEVIRFIRDDGTKPVDWCYDLDECPLGDKQACLGAGHDQNSGNEMTFTEAGNQIERLCNGAILPVLQATPSITSDG